jgi:uncharacterized membrane protein
MTTSAAEIDVDPDPDDAVARTPKRWPYGEMLVSSLLSLLASFVLSVDAILLAANPDADLSCNISSSISCGAVGSSWQANLFGWPNAFLGLIAEPVVITVAILGLAGMRFPRWFLLAAQFVYTLGLIFALWLFYQSYFNINAMCPWCLLVTATTILVWTSMTRINIEAGNFGEGVRRKLAPALSYNADIIGSVLLIAVLGAMVVYRYA